MRVPIRLIRTAWRPRIGLTRIFGEGNVAYPSGPSRGAAPKWMRCGACNPCFPIELHKRIAMTKTFGRWVLGLALAAGTGGVAVPMLVRADQPAPQQLATVDQLKAEAFKALKLGQFDRSSELLTRA